MAILLVGLLVGCERHAEPNALLQSYVVRLLYSIFDARWYTHNHDNAEPVCECKSDDDPVALPNWIPEQLAALYCQWDNNS
jgi:hypothetical protein